MFFYRCSYIQMDRKLHKRIIIIFNAWLLLVTLTQGEFLVNVRTEAGNIVKESISEDIAQSRVTLEYEDWDLTTVTQVVDFRASLNIFRIILYGEIELNQPTAQVLCFVTNFSRSEFIEPDAVSKLRQVKICDSKMLISSMPRTMCE